MGVCNLVLCSLATVTSCIDASVRIVTKSPKVEPLLIFSISLTFCLLYLGYVGEPLPGVLHQVLQGGVQGQGPALPVKLYEEI
jgi:hypothetical protein